MPEKEKYNLLLIDDRPENLIALELFLDHPEYNLIKAESGMKALELVLDYEFVLILTDVIMPGMDGYEVAELLRGRKETMHIPIIFITAVSKEQKYIFKGYECGAVDYLIKPVDPDVLNSKVKIFIDLFKQRKIIEEQANQLKCTVKKSVMIRDFGMKLRLIFPQKVMQNFHMAFARIVWKKYTAKPIIRM